MIFAGAKSGHPWHGVWSGTTGKITTPGGGDIDCPGVPPKARLQNLPIHIDTAHAGDCYMLAVPGMPAVTTTPSEAAAGQTWLNYGLISGARNRLMGIELGAGDWIYVAPDKTRWRASFSAAPLALATTTSTTVSVTLKRFGEFPQTVTGSDEQVFANMLIDLALDMPSAAQSIFPLTGDVAARAYLAIEDIRPDGARAVIAVQSELAVESTCPLTSRVLFSAKEIRLSGTPPAATIEIVTVAATSALQSFEILHRWQKFRGVSWYKDIDNVNQVYVGEETPAHSSAVTAYLSPLFLQSFVGLVGGEDWGAGWPALAAGGEIQFVVSSARYAYSLETVIGLRYAADDGSLEKIVQTTAWDGNYAATVVPVAADDHEYSASGSLSGSGSLTISRRNVASGALIGDQGTDAMSISASWSAAAPGSSVWSGGYTLAGETTSFSHSVTVTAGSFYTSVPIGVLPASMALHGAGMLDLRATAASEQVFPLRYTNALYGACRRTVHPGVSRSMRFFGIYGKVGADATPASATGTASYPVFCSEHPVTGQILRGIAASAFV